MKAVIFDMDGVLIDSEPMHFQVEEEILVEAGGTFDRNFHERFVGTTDTYLWSFYKEKFSLSTPLDELLYLKKERFAANIDKIPLVEGIIKLLQSLKNQGYPMAIASANNGKAVNKVIERHRLSDYISYAISGDDIERSKPDPEIFLKAAEKIKVEPSSCLVIEDAKNGVLAAKAAGMQCIGYLNPNSGDQDLSKADLLINNYRNLSLEKMKSLFS